MELLEKLAALIPRPYVNLIVYHGVLAPNAKWRGEVVVFGPARVESEPPARSPKKVAASYNRTWAELMRRGLNIDVLESPDCRGRLRFAAAIMLSTAVRRILSLEPSIFAQNACRDPIRGRFRAHNLRVLVTGSVHCAVVGGR
jgi:hypothetical protein